MKPPTTLKKWRGEKAPGRGFGISKCSMLGSFSFLHQLPAWLLPPQSQAPSCPTLVLYSVCSSWTRGISPAPNLQSDSLVGPQPFLNTAWLGQIFAKSCPTSCLSYFHFLSPTPLLYSWTRISFEQSHSPPSLEQHCCQPSASEHGSHTHSIAVLTWLYTPMVWWHSTSLFLGF